MDWPDGEYSLKHVAKKVKNNVKFIVMTEFYMYVILTYSTCNRDAKYRMQILELAARGLNLF
jgi:hypothetical protein